MLRELCRRWHSFCLFVLLWKLRLEVLLELEEEAFEVVLVVLQFEKQGLGRVFHIAQWRHQAISELRRLIRWEFLVLCLMVEDLEEALVRKVWQVKD